MRTVTKRLDSFSGGGFGGVFKQQLDVGMTIDEIVLELFGGVKVYQLQLIELVLNGDSIVSVSAEHFRDLEVHLGHPGSSDRVRIPFKDLGLVTDAGQLLTALVTLPTDNLVLSIRVSEPSAEQRAGGSKAELSGYLKLSQSRSVREFLPRIYQENIAIGMSGENNFKTFMSGPRIRRIFFVSSRVTGLRVKRNNLELFDLSGRNNDDEIRHLGFEKVAGTYIFSPVSTGFGIVDSLRTAGSRMEFLPFVSSAGDVSAVFHTLENANNPTLDPLQAR